MHYLPYKFSCEKVAAMTRKAGVMEVSKKNRDEGFIREALRFLYHNEPQMVQTLDCMVHAEEHKWMESDRTVYFPESVELAKGIATSSYAIEDAAALYEGTESFVICLPDGLEFGGKKVGSGLLVNIINHTERETDMLHPFFDWISMPRANCSFDNSGGIFGIYVCYQDGKNAHEYMRVCLPAQNVIHALKYETFEEYAEYIGSTNKFDYFAGADLNSPEMNYQFDMLKFVAGFMVYKKALPNRVKEGLPAHAKPKQVNSPVIKNTKPVTLTSPKGIMQSHTKQGHYRSWHFRQLMNERYYGGEHKHLPKGSRVIFVSDSYVGRDIEAKTVVT